MVEVGLTTHLLKCNGGLLFVANTIKSDHGSVSILLARCNVVLRMGYESRINNLGNRFVFF